MEIGGNNLRNDASYTFDQYRTLIGESNGTIRWRLCTSAISNVAEIAIVTRRWVKIRVKSSVKKRSL